MKRTRLLIRFIIVIIIFTIGWLIQNHKYIKIVNASILGDCNLNGIVDLFDLQLLSNSYNKSEGETGYNANCNFNTDTTVDIFDFQILSNNFGSTGVINTPTATIRLTPTSMPTPTTIISGTAIWWGDADSNGLASWKALQCPSGSCDIVNDPENRYGKVFRATLNTGETYSGDGKARAEYYGTKLANGSVLNYFEGNDYYFGWRSRISDGIYTNSGNSGNFIQLKGDSSCGGPAVGLTMVNGYLTIRSELYGVFWTGPKMTSFTGTWHDIVFHVHFSKDAAKGFVEAWLDGVKQTFKDGSELYHVATMCPNDSYIYLKMGYYRGSHPEYPSGTHWFDSPRLGTTYNSVVPR